MPRQNRVTPFGDLIAVPERGEMLGNRGVLHDSQQQIVRYSQGRRWLVCRLEFHNRHRTIMRPRSYTELFFLDEATALAAGHRPCAECRHQEYQEFRRCWAAAHGEPSGNLPSADWMDAEIHKDRLMTTGIRKTYQDDIAALGEGVFIVYSSAAWLLWRSAMLRWTPGGYGEGRARPTHGAVTVLTPRVTARAIAAGYIPLVHSSAAALELSPSGRRP
jgi:hypothetical protein